MLRSAGGRPRCTLRRLMLRRFPRRLCFAAWLLGRFTLATSAVAAEPPRVVELQYVRDANAASCADEDELESKASMRLGYVPFRDQAPLVVTVHLSKSASGFRAVLASEDTLTHTRGERVLTSAASDCGELVESIALTMSVLVDPLTLTRTPRVATPAPAASSPPVVLPAASAGPIAVAEPKKPLLITLEAGLGALASVGAGPSPSVRVEPSLALRVSAVSIGIEGRVDSPSGSASIDGRSVRSNLLLGSLVPCLRGRLLFGCALVSVGALDGTGEGVTLSSPRTTFYAAGGARAGAEWTPTQTLALGAYLELLATFTRTDLRLNGQVIWTTPPLSGVLGLRATGSFR
jgi:hypothetical protein